MHGRRSFGQYMLASNVRSSKIAQFLHTIEENTSHVFFDLQIKIPSHKTCLKEVIELFFDLAYHADAP